MTRKSVFVMVLMVFLADTLGVAVKVGRVEAGGTIYIRADGSVEPSETPIFSIDNITYAFTGNIYDEIVIERNNITLDGTGYTLQGLGSGTGIYLLERTNVSIINIEIRAFEYSILLTWSYNNSLAGNNINTNSNGIWLEGSSNNTVSGNDINNCIVGVVICCSSSNNAIFGTT